MCGRCIIFTVDEVLDIIKDIENKTPLNKHPDWPAQRMEAYPRSYAPLIVPKFDTASGTSLFTNDSFAVAELSWGFEETWKQGVVFNTRIESADKPTWRDSVEHRRCIIPVHSFFETHQSETYLSPKTGKPIKRPYEFCTPDSEVILIGCIWRNDCFSMVTTEANAIMSPIHHRMPLIIRQDELPIWFSSEYRDLADRSSIALEAEPAR